MVVDCPQKIQYQTWPEGLVAQGTPQQVEHRDQWVNESPEYHRIQISNALETERRGENFWEYCMYNDYTYSCST